MAGRLLLSPGDPRVLRRRAWILAAILALLFHLLFLLPRIPGLSFSPSDLLPPRVNLHEIDPHKLESIRQQWKSREKALLLDKNLKSPTAAEPPKDARYMSDRNIKVDKETISKRTAIIPKSGASGEEGGQKTPPLQVAPVVKPFPGLGNLGIPLPAAPTEPSPPPQIASDHAGPGGNEGGNQYIIDPNAVEGSETMLNSEESVYYSFYSRLYEALGPIWQSQIRALLRAQRFPVGDYTTLVDGVYFKDGTLKEVDVIKGSSQGPIDDVALNAWKKVGRMPNPPTGLLDEKEQVHIGFRFTVNLYPGMQPLGLPLERAY